MNSSFHSFQQKIEDRAGKKLKLKINDNRSTMLSVRWEPDCTRVSMHRMFLEAPKNIMQALACYICQEEDSLAPSIRVYIENNLKNYDYSHQVDPHALKPAGTTYDLQKIYQRLNNAYFDGALQLKITWFGSQEKRSRSRLTFGLYYDPLRLIKINRLLDHPSFPDYVVSFVVYHEMLHHVCPSYYEKGQLRIHTKEFKQKEKLFEAYPEAQAWIKEHHTSLFI